MKKILTFIPLGIGISSAIIYIFNLINFRIVNNSLTTLEILSNLKVYLYISIICFIVYFLIKVLDYIKNRSSYLTVHENEKNNDDNIPVAQDNFKEEIFIKKIEDENKKDNDDKLKNIIKEAYEPLEFKIENNNKILNEEYNKKESFNFNKSSLFHKYCFNCGEELFDSDKYCNNCGTSQFKRKKTNGLIKKIINIVEVIILILIIYFLLNMLFEYKEKIDHNFKSPFKVSMTK